MEALDALLHGLTIAAQPMNLLYAAIGVLISLHPPTGPMLARSSRMPLL